jgi:hypothetical protein
MPRQLNTDRELPKKRAPARTPEARENQMVALAMDLVEKRLIKGTASSQETTHFLKLGSTRDRIEKEILEKKKELVTAQTDALKSQKRMDEVYTKALAAMRSYSGNSKDDERYDD